MSTLDPLVSVVMPAFNAGAWIGEALASVATQSIDHTQLEVIVVDDGSTDDTEAATHTALRSTDIPHSVVRHARPLGVSAARNAGVRLARGEWVQFLDADDVLAPTKLAHQAQAMGRVGNRTGVVYSPWTRLTRSEDGHWTEGGLQDPIVGDDAVVSLLKTDGFIATGSQVFRRSALEDVGGFSESRHYVEDVELLLRLAMRRWEFYRVASATPLFKYRSLPGSASRRNPDGLVDGCVQNASLAETYWRSESQLTQPRIEALAEIYFQATRHFAGRDWQRFDALVNRIRALPHSLVPPGSRALRVLSRVVGYRRAEQCAIAWRRWRDVSGHAA